MALQENSKLVKIAEALNKEFADKFPYFRCEARQGITDHINIIVSLEASRYWKNGILENSRYAKCMIVVDTRYETENSLYSFEHNSGYGISKIHNRNNRTAKQIENYVAASLYGILA